jgi:tetratricopeptide (TPR) repeat protein
MRLLNEKMENSFDDLAGLLDIRRSGRNVNGMEHGPLPRSYFDIMGIKEMNHSARRFEITKEILEAYLDADPDNAEMLIGLAVVNYAQGELEEAEDILDKVLAYEPVNDDARALLAVIDKRKKMG